MPHMRSDFAYSAAIPRRSAPHAAKSLMTSVPLAQIAFKGVRAPPRHVAVAATACGFNAESLACIQIDPALGRHRRLIGGPRIDQKATGRAGFAACHPLGRELRPVAAVNHRRRFQQLVLAPERQTATELASAAGTGNQLEPGNAAGKLCLDDLDRGDQNIG